VFAVHQLNSSRVGWWRGLQSEQWGGELGSALVLGSFPSIHACCLGGKLVCAGPLVSGLSFPIDVAFSAGDVMTEWEAQGMCSLGFVF